MDKQKIALERLVKEGASALSILVQDDPRWNDSHFAAALDSAAQVFGYTGRVAYIRHINDPDTYPFSGNEHLPL